MLTFGVLARITRLDTSSLIFLAVFAPIYFVTNDTQLALLQALPILTISMCGYIVNDLHDIEIDRENHPSRPLPSGQLSPTLATILYFSLLAASLTMIKAFASPQVIFLDLLLLIAFINYDYIITHFPYLKNAYVGVVGVLPILVSSSVLHRTSSRIFLFLALFLLLFGREVLMDVLDVKGDGDTLTKRVGVRRAQQIGFAAILLGAAVLLFVADSWIGIALAAVLLAFDLLFLYLWAMPRYRRIITYALKVQMATGIYYLIQ